MPPSPLRTKLLHIHITTRIPYTTSLLLQDQLLGLHWRHRESLKSPSPSQRQPPAPPPPILLSFSTHPTYTVGRRHLLANPLSAAQIEYLTAATTSTITTSPLPPSPLPQPTPATFYPTSRGGLLTYHGPGQLTAYLIIDLRRFGLSARCYVRCLENAVSKTCNQWFKEAGITDRIAGRSDVDPGVWMLEQRRRENSGSEENGKDEVEGVGSDMVLTDRKICALGVQVNRGVTAHGLGLNLWDAKIEDELKPWYTNVPMTEPETDMGAAVQQPHDSAAAIPTATAMAVTQPNGYLSFGFPRITACGLPNKSATWLQKELSLSSSPSKLTQAVARQSETAEPLAYWLASTINEMRGAGKDEIALHGYGDAEGGKGVQMVRFGEEEIRAVEGGRKTVEGLLRVRVEGWEGGMVVE